MDIAENRVEGLELQWTGELRGAKAPFAKYNEKSVAVVVFCYNHCGEKEYRKGKYTIGEMGEPTGERKEKMEREYRKTYAKKIYIIKKKYATGQFVP